MTKHIGIVACSAQGAALCYRILCVEAEIVMGEYLHPEITMHTHCLGDYMNFIREGDQQGVADLMLSSADKLKSAGANLIICPDNTIHEAFDMVQEKSPLPWLHIAEEVAKEAENWGYKRLGVLGTSYLMEGPVYRKVFEAHNLEYVIPKPEDREKINAVIFDELVRNIRNPDSVLYFYKVIKDMKYEHCDAIVLGCTEIPLIITEESSFLPILDSTRLLARAALREAVG